MSSQFFLLLFTHFIHPGKKPVSHLLTAPLLLFSLQGTMILSHTGNILIPPKLSSHFINLFRKVFSIFFDAHIILKLLLLLEENK